MRVSIALLVALLSLPVAAEEADPPLPRPRPAAALVAETPPIPLPRLRPAAPAETQDTAVPPKAPDAAVPTPPDAPIAPATPDAHITVPEIPAVPRIYQTACPAVLLGLVEAKALPPLSEANCGEQSPLALTGVLANGRMVPVSGGVETDCNMASALPSWIESIDSYLFAKENTRIAEVLVGTSYMCRNVNSATTGNLSFHAFADAVDVVGFKLEDGRRVTVAGGWADALSPEGRLLRFAHDSACGHFTTTLGPEANAEHHDHLHIDLGCHGKTCTSRLCE